MTKKIFTRMVSISVITFVASMVLFMGVLYDYFSRQLKHELETEAEYIAEAVDLNGIEYLDNVDVPINKRITWIDSTGKVVFDSAASPETMENHADRDEFIDAVKYGTGYATRKSYTLSQKTSYYAVRINDGSVVRIAHTQNTIWSLMLGMMYPICIISMIILVVSGLVSHKTAKKIVEPINKVDLNEPVIDEEYDEFSPLVRRIENQNRMIKTQMSLLARQQEEFKKIMEHMNEGLIVIDNKRDILVYNNSAANIFGIKKDVLGENIYSVNKGEKFKNIIEEAVSGANVSCELEMNSRCYKLIANPVKLESKNYGAVILIFDITEDNSNEQMRREFTSNVSHELKTPLTSIYGMSELLTDPNMDRIMAVDFAKSIHDETGRLITLVNDIIKLSLLDENQVPQEKEPVDIYELACDVAERLRPAASARNIDIAVKGAPCTVNGVYTILSEIMYNLCENAIKYNKEGGSVIITADTENGRPYISIEDTGIGIAPEHRERVFERFYRVDKSHSKEIGGTGLGLSIVKHGAIYHDAKIELESEENIGTKITVRF